MPSIWVTPPESGTIVESGVIRFSDGQTFTLSSVPGKGWKTSRLGKLAVAVQAMLDRKLVIADLPEDDIDKNADAAELQGRYGNRRFHDGSGNLVDRSTLFSVEFVNDDLFITMKRVI